MTRYGMVIQLKPEKIEEYKKLHQHVWPEVLAILSKYHIKNYSIFLKDNLLFGYLEYHGNDYADDMKKIANEEVTKRWWKLTDPCQESLSTSGKGEWWSLMEEVFHLE
jgi:L-rhamnose mutarotase